MDGFDDLLSSSRRELEENPFDDPFAKRSASPDPWSNPYAQQETPPVQQEASLDDSTAEAPAEASAELIADPPFSSGPLDLTALDEPADEPLPSSATTTSGFREFSVSEPSPRLPDSTTPTLLSEASDPSPLPPQNPVQPVVATSATPSGPAIPSDTGDFATLKPSDPPPFVSPLDSPQKHITPSFANLALGGETAAGWQAPGDWHAAREPSASTAGWHSRQPTDEDPALMLSSMGSILMGCVRQRSMGAHN
jgi:sorting nexin-1/2